MRTPCRSVLAGAVAVVATLAMTGTSMAAIGTEKVWEEDSLLRPAFSASGDILGDERPELVVTDYGDYQVSGSEPVLAPGAMYIYTNVEPGGDLDDWERITVFDQSENIIFPSQPQLADVDGDGDVDIINGGGFFWDSDAGLSRGSLTWWENQDDGQTWVRHSLAEDSPWAYHNVQYGDLDGDGIDDIVTVGEQGMDKQIYWDDLTELQFYKGLGDGDFAPMVALADRGGSSPVLRDVDGDGDLDVLSAQYFHVNPLVINPDPETYPPGDGSFIWFENTSDGTGPLTADDFTKHEISRGQGPSYGIYPVEDLYGDGVVRYIGVNHTNTTPGTPGPPIQFLADPNAFVLTPGEDITEPWHVEELADSYDEGARWASANRPGQAAPGKVVTGDFDGDGDLDLVISGDGDFRAMLVEQVEPGVFHQSVLPGSEGFGQAGVTVADFDADGRLDVALSSFENQTVAVWSLFGVPEAEVAAVTNGDTAVPTSSGLHARVGDLLTISSGNSALWEPGVNWRVTICTDAAGTACPPGGVEGSLWAGSPAPYVPAAGAPVDASGKILPTQVRLASVASFTGLVYLKVYQGSESVVIPLNLVTDDRVVDTTATSVQEGTAVPFTGSGYYPGETVSVATSAAGAAAADAVAGPTGEISGSVVADKPGTVKLVATAIGGQAESGEFTVTAKPVVTPPVVKDTTAPVVKLTKPGKKKAVRAKSWKRIKGTVRDRGANASGPRDVRIKLVVKTAKGQWKFYNGKKWKNAKNKKQAFKKAKVQRDRTVAKGKWNIKVKKPARGRVLVRYWATDKAGNATKKKTVNQRITKK